MIANIRPGILVALRTRIAGGCEYQKTDLEGGGVVEGDAVAVTAEIKRWETTRVIEDPEEWERAKAARATAQNAIRKVCVRSDFGLLCPEELEAKLDAAVAAAHAVVDAHNETAKLTRVSIYALKGRVASTDEEALKGIAAEVRGLLDQMDSGVAAGDVAAVRDAAARAKKLSAMLDDETSEAVRAAVSEAREAAKAIVRRVVDGEEQLAVVLQDVTLEALKTARIAFLDIDEALVDGEGQWTAPATVVELDDMSELGERRPARAAERQLDVDTEETGS